MDPALAIELAALSRQKAMNDVIDRGDSAMQQFYSGAAVFVTGGSGFLGKQLIEKLFRSCDINKIFVLLRPKKERTVQQRVEDMLEDPVYDMVRKKKPDFADRIMAVEGDISEIRLGISDKNWTMLTEEVNVLFHMAATTRFDESLRVATVINVRGTREALTLGKECKNLKSFVYISTTYANATDNFVEKQVMEKFYPSPLPPEVMIDMVETIGEERFNAIENNLIKGYPNTYTFTKSIAEELVRSSSGTMPISVIRPAVVISSYREPTPGWADMSCAYGASGLILGPATGLIHVTYAGNGTRYSLVPVDYVNNAILAAAWHTGTKCDRDITIYTVSSARNLFHWDIISTKLREIAKVLPTPLAMWYMFIISTANRPLFLILTWLLHYIPGYLMDGICVLLGKPPRFMKLYRRVYKASLALSYFTTHSWLFNDANTDKLFQSLSPNDKLIFNFDTTDIDIIEFVTLWCVGLRKYLIKDGIKDTEYARKKQYWLHKLHCVATIGYIFVVYKLLRCVLFGLTYVFG